MKGLRSQNRELVVAWGEEYQDQEASRRPRTGGGNEVGRVMEAIPREEEGVRGAF